VIDDTFTKNIEQKMELLQEKCKKIVSFSEAMSEKG